MECARELGVNEETSEVELRETSRELHREKGRVQVMAQPFCGQKTPLLQTKPLKWCKGSRKRLREAR